METILTERRRRRVSWGSIFGGVITSISISILLGILGTSIGLYMFDPTADNPVSGMGVTMSIWTILALLISLAAGGFVAGKLAGADGIIHGFLVWATTMIITVIFTVMTLVGAIRAAGNILGSLSSAAGSVLSGAGSIVEGGISELSDQAQDLFGDMDFESSRQDMRREVRQILRSTGVRELQPEYLQNQLRMVRSDLRKTVKRVVARPKDADATVNKFLERLQGRVDKITTNVNKDDIVRAISSNTNMTRAEAEETVDQYIDLVNDAKEQVNNLQQNINEALQEWQQVKQDALKAADDATNAAGSATLWAFIAMLLGAGLGSWMGFLGVRMTRRGYEA